MFIVVCFEFVVFFLLYFLSVSFSSDWLNGRVDSQVIFSESKIKSSMFVDAFVYFSNLLLFFLELLSRFLPSRKLPLIVVPAFVFHYSFVGRNWKGACRSTKKTLQTKICEATAS